MPTKANLTLISRRCFLRSLSVIAGGGLLAACAVGEEGRLPPNRLEPAFSAVELPMPRAAASIAAAAAQEGEAELPGFLALSALLTGVDNLDPTLGSVYLQSLRTNSEFSVSISELLEQAQAGLPAPPTTLEELESSGIFESETTRQLADKITEYWYTGIYETPEGEQAVATFVDALAWRTLTFTKPQSLCGTYRFWTEPPEAAID
jgi:hypothetical protein